MARAASGPMSADPRKRFKIISYHLKQPWGLRLKPCSKKHELFQTRSDMQTEKCSLGIGDLTHGTAGSAALDLAAGKHLTLSPETQCYNSLGQRGRACTGQFDFILEILRLPLGRSYGMSGKAEVKSGHSDRCEKLFLGWTDRHIYHHQVMRY